MPLVTGHGLAGVAAACYYKKDRIRLREAVFCILAANLPDIDYIPGFFLGAPKRFHPSFTHSIFAVVVFTSIVYLAYRKFPSEERRRMTRMLGAAYFSHIFLDIVQVDTYLANGIGVPLFYPFTTRCYQTGWNWLPSITSFMDFSSFSSVIRSLPRPELLSYLIREQLTVGAMAGTILGVRWLYARKRRISPG